MKFLLEVIGLIAMYAFVIIVIVVMLGGYAIKTAIEVAIGWIEGRGKHEKF